MPGKRKGGQGDVEVSEGNQIEAEGPQKKRGKTNQSRSTSGQARKPKGGTRPIRKPAKDDDFLYHEMEENTRADQLRLEEFAFRRHSSREKKVPEKYEDNPRAHYVEKQKKNEEEKKAKQEVIDCVNNSKSPVISPEDQSPQTEDGQGRDQKETCEIRDQHEKNGGCESPRAPKSPFNHPDNVSVTPANDPQNKDDKSQEGLSASPRNFDSQKKFARKNSPAQRQESPTKGQTQKSQTPPARGRKPGKKKPDEDADWNETEEKVKTKPINNKPKGGKGGKKKSEIQQGASPKTMSNQKEVQSQENGHPKSQSPTQDDRNKQGQKNLEETDEHYNISETRNNLPQKPNGKTKLQGDQIGSGTIPESDDDTETRVAESTGNGKAQKTARAQNQRKSKAENLKGQKRKLEKAGAEGEPPLQRRKGQDAPKNAQPKSVLKKTKISPDPAPKDFMPKVTLEIKSPVKVVPTAPTIKSKSPEPVLNQPESQILHKQTKIPPKQEKHHVAEETALNGASLIEANNEAQNFYSIPDHVEAHVPDWIQSGPSRDTSVQQNIEMNLDNQVPDLENSVKAGVNAVLSNNDLGPVLQNQVSGKIVESAQDPPMGMPESDNQELAQDKQEDTNTDFIPELLSQNAEIAQRTIVTNNDETSDQPGKEHTNVSKIVEKQALDQKAYKPLYEQFKIDTNLKKQPSLRSVFEFLCSQRVYSQYELIQVLTARKKAEFTKMRERKNANLQRKANYGTEAQVERKKKEEREENRKRKWQLVRDQKVENAERFAKMYKVREERDISVKANYSACMKEADEVHARFLALKARRDADDQAKSRYANLEANSDPRSNVQIQEAQNAKDSVLKQDPHSTHNPVSKANTKASTQNSGRSTRVSGQALGSSPTLGFVMEDNQQEKRTAGQQSPMQISEGKKNGKITQTKKQSSDLKKLASPALNGISKNEPGEKTPSRFGIENGATKSGGAIKKASKAQSQSKSQSSRQKKASQGIEINGHHCPGLPNIVNSPNRDMSSPRLIISPRSRTPKNGSTLAPKPYQKSPLNPQDTLEDRIKQNDGVALRSDPPDLSHLELDDQREILDEIHLPAIWTHRNAFAAHKKCVEDYHKRRNVACKQNRRTIKGRNLCGFAARCGMLQQDAHKVLAGCGTALSDIHYTCESCTKEADFEANAEAKPQEKVDASLDYCLECVKAMDFRCPNPKCGDRENGNSWPEPFDFLQHENDLPLGERAFAKNSAKEAYHEHGEYLAELQSQGLSECLEKLPKEYKKRNGRKEPMFEVTVEINDEYQMYKNGMAEGIPVLIKNVGGYFDNEPFSAESMFKLALEAAQDVESKDLVVKSQMSGEDGGTSVSTYCTIKQFFQPMLNATRRSGLSAEVKEDTNHVGYKLPDFGVQPPAQTTSFWEGLKSIGMGDICRGDSCHNIAKSLRTEEQDRMNGTQKPDLGPKFYIARPLLKENGKYDKEGFSFTPLHCDLADAVNYSCWGDSATWHIFHRRDRPALLQYLKDCYGPPRANHDGEMEPERSGEDMLWNPQNHTLLTDEDFSVLRDKYNVTPWKFTQRAGEIVVIPAGCAHQVKNDGGGPNIKIAQDFIAPQSALVCLELMKEMRAACQEDKLQAALTMRFAGDDAYQKRDVAAKIFEMETCAE